jgi:hypothetical protein
MAETKSDLRISEGAKTLQRLSKRVDKDHPSWEDINTLEKWIDDHPELFQEIWNYSSWVRVALILKISDTESTQVALRKEQELISNSLGGKGSPKLEQLLIENILITRLYLRCLEHQMTQYMGTFTGNIAVIQFMERRLSAAQNRHLRACETLARVRKLARNTPALQVNIATERGQQVNIAGDFIDDDLDKS